MPIVKVPRHGKSSLFFQNFLLFRLHGRFLSDRRAVTTTKKEEVVIMGNLGYNVIQLHCMVNTATVQVQSQMQELWHANYDSQTPLQFYPLSITPKFTIHLSKTHRLYIQNLHTLFTANLRLLRIQKRSIFQNRFRNWSNVRNGPQRPSVSHPSPLP